LVCSRLEQTYGGIDRVRSIQFSRQRIPVRAFTEKLVRAPNEALHNGGTLRTLWLFPNSSVH